LAKLFVLTRSECVASLYPT